MPGTRQDEPYRLDRHDLGDVTVVAFTIRKLISADEVQAIGEALESIVDDENRTRLVLDLGRVEFATSAFLGRILWVLIKLKARGGRMALCHLTTELARMFPANQPLQPDRLCVFETMVEAVAWAAEAT